MQKPAYFCTSIATASRCLTMQIAAKQSRRLAVAIAPNVEAIAGSNDLQVSTAKCLEQLSEADHRFSIEERKVKS
jgi:hypothetical protein